MSGKQSTNMVQYLLGFRISEMEGSVKPKFLESSEVQSSKECVLARRRRFFFFAHGFCSLPML